MGIADSDHGRQDRVPRLGVLEGCVGEHATIPADVLDASSRGILQPIACALDDIELAIRVIGRAMLAGLVVRARTVDMPIVLRDVKIDRPRPQFVGHLLVGTIKLFLRVGRSEHRILGCVVSKEIEISVGQVGLEPEGFGHTDPFEDIEHIAPAVHPRPADLTFGGEALPVVLCNFRCELKRLDDPRGVGFGIRSPLVDPELGAIDPDHSVLANAMILKHVGDAARRLDRREEFFSRCVITHRGISDRTRPNRRDERTDGKAVACDLIRDLSQIVIARVGIGVRQEQKIVNSLEFLTIDIRCCSQFQHPRQRNGWLLARAISLAYQSRPHRIVQFRMLFHCVTSVQLFVNEEGYGEFVLIFYDAVRQAPLAGRLGCASGPK
jgi:hypothetical protein